MDNRKTGSNFNLLSTVETSIDLSALFLIVQPQFKMAVFMLETLKSSRRI